MYKRSSGVLAVMVLTAGMVWNCSSDSSSVNALQFPESSGADEDGVSSSVTLSATSSADSSAAISVESSSTLLTESSAANYVDNFFNLFTGFL